MKAIWHADALLGEGPVWDAGRGLLWFVDIKRRLLHRHDPRDGSTDSWPAPAQIGWALPATGGALLVGLQTGLSAFDPATGQFRHVADVEPDLPGNRLNDATVAADGRVWFGSMDDGETAPSGRFYRWDGCRVTPVAIPPVCITNGPATSPDGTVLYHVDTIAGVIHASHIGADREISATRVFATIDPADGNPDGVSTDAAGNLWVGLWGGWRARLYAPDGTILREVRLPAANVTKVALGGPDLRTAYATTASVGLSPEARAAQPEAGALFASPVDQPGHALPLACLD